MPNVPLTRFHTKEPTTRLESEVIEECRESGSLLAIVAQLIQNIMFNRYSLTVSILWICLVCQEVSSFAIIPTHRRSHSISTKSTVHLSTDDDYSSSPLSSRREWTKAVFTSIIATGAILGNSKSEPALAADAGDTIWKTGKAPQVPGQKPKDRETPRGRGRIQTFYVLFLIARVNVRIVPDLMVWHDRPQSVSLHVRTFVAQPTNSVRLLLFRAKERKQTLIVAKHSSE